MLHGPFVGDVFGGYTILEERPAVLVRRMGDIIPQRTFLVRCHCGATDVIKRASLAQREVKGTLGCGACTPKRQDGALRTKFPARWPDGIYGTWQLLRRQDCNGVPGWLMSCRTCGATRSQDGLREARANIPCAKCLRHKSTEARMRKRAAQRGVQIVRLQLG